MSNFRYSICEPANPQIIEKGRIDSSEIMTIFKTFQWKQKLEESERLKEVYFSPSLEFENLTNKNGIAISAIGKPDNYEFYIFYKRPKTRKTWFGLSSKLDQNYLSELWNQNENDTTEILKALLDNNLSFLEEKFSK
ncbi:hypothetical protein ACFSJW_00640 [Flavobacterium artemisiae]|uniref:Uncharacterized protein n=1 Tax=Flavobacterium artemisiae TaxID=2126556 RepID=A0ABW4HHZ4_9FLAO